MPDHDCRIQQMMRMVGSPLQQPLWRRLSSEPRVQNLQRSWLLYRSILQTQRHPMAILTLLWIVQAARKLLSSDRNPPIGTYYVLLTINSKLIMSVSTFTSCLRRTIADALIHSGILPVLVGCLQAGGVSATEHPRFYHHSKPGMRRAGC